MIPLQCFPVPLKFGAYYITGQWGDFRVNNAFSAFFYLFHHKISVFMNFVSFFDEVSNFRARISANQKQ